MLDFAKLTVIYREALLQQVVPFWLSNSRDEAWGGYFDALTATGDPVTADKSVALLAQQIWSFGWLYNTIEPEQCWLDHALHGANFLTRFGLDEKMNAYALVDRIGKPVAPGSGKTTDAYCVMAYAQLHRATGNDEWAMLAKQVLFNLIQQRNTQRTKQQRTLGGFRQWQHLEEPVVVLKTLLATQFLLSEEDWKEYTEQVVEEILQTFLDKRLNILRESILPDGAFSHTPQGRRLSPALTFEAANALLDIALKTSNRKLSLQVVTWCLSMCEQAWDEVNSGLHQYVDFLRQPILDSTWQYRTARVHLQALAVLIKSFFHTHHPDCLRWFQKIHDYTFQHFPDGENPGWHLALDQQNQVLLPVKATPAEGCYHFVKPVSETISFLTQCAQLQPPSRKFRLA